MRRAKPSYYLARAICAVCVCGLNVLTTCCAFGSNLSPESFHGRQKTVTSSSLEPTCDDFTEKSDHYNVARSKILDLLRVIDSPSSDGDPPSPERIGVKSTVVHLVGTGRFRSLK